MAKQWTVPFTPKRESLSKDVTYTATGIATIANNISVYVGNNIPDYRQVEIIAGLKWLVNGIRDRNLLDVQFKGVNLYTVADIDRLTTAGRQTSSQFTLVTEDVIALGMGLTATSVGMLTSTGSAFDNLIDAVLESLKDQ